MDWKIIFIIIALIFARTVYWIIPIIEMIMRNIRDPRNRNLVKCMQMILTTISREDCFF